MRWIILAGEALTPLALRKGRNPENMETLNYIPGTVLRGALAEAHLNLRPGKKEEFRSFFLEQRVLYGNLMPATFPENELQDQAAPVNFLPLTAVTCKRCKGFAFQSRGDKEKHGIRDFLLPKLIFALSGELNAEPLLQASDCPDCPSVMERATGFYRRGFNKREAGQPKIMTAVITRTGISRKTGTVQEGILFNREVVEKGAFFWGYALIEKGILDDWQTFLEEAAGEGMIRVGTGRTSGLGRLSIGVIEVKNSFDSPAEIKRRCRRFNELLRSEAKKYRVNLSHSFYLPLTLLSDAIVVDGALLYRTVLTGNWLEKVLRANDVQLVYQAAERRRIVGWNSLLGLPRPDEWGIAMGSVFVYGLSKEPDYELLWQLQQKGIGERIDEGFGRICWADRWHEEVELL